MKMGNEAGTTNGRSSKKLDQIMEIEKASKNNSPRDSQLCDLMHKFELIDANVENLTVEVNNLEANKSQTNREDIVINDLRQESHKLKSEKEDLRDRNPNL